MDNYTAVAIAEGLEEVESTEKFLEAWQHLVDTGLAFRLQGWFGRTAMALVNQGLIEYKE